MSLAYGRARDGGEPDRSKPRKGPKDPIPGRVTTILKGIGVNRNTLAAAADVNLGTIDKVNRGGEGIRISSVIRIAWALGVRPSDLIPELNQRPKTPGLVQIMRERRKREREIARRLKDNPNLK